MTSTTDPYREHVLLSLNNSVIYNRLKEKCTDGTDNGGAGLLSLVEDAVTYCYSRSKVIIKYMGEYTLHDGEHLFRVLRLMGLLIPEATLIKLSNPELSLLVLTAFFHDIGMAPSAQEIRSWLGEWNVDGKPSSQELEAHKKFERYKLGRQRAVDDIYSLRSQGRHVAASELETYLITDYIRLTHADRAAEIIEEDWSGKIVYKDVDLTVNLAMLCRSHNEDAVRLLKLDHSLLTGQHTFVCLPFIGVILRLADVLDFDGNRTPNVLYAHLGVKDAVSLEEWQKHRSVESWTFTPTDIFFKATCSHPAIEHAIRSFCDQIDYELLSAASILNNLHDTVRKPFPNYYQIPLPSKVDRAMIKAKTDSKGIPVYMYRDTKFTLDKGQIVDLLMGTKLYGSPSVALRELIQNSVDACKLRAKMEESWGNTAFKQQLSIKFTKDSNGLMLEVLDNGVGMDLDIIDKFYSKVGSSYYTSQEFLELKSSLKSSFIPTSRFGIGILSSFMISDKIDVETKRIYESHSSSEPLAVSISGQDTIFYIKKGSTNQPGTVTRLLLREDNPWKDFSDAQIIDSIKQTIPFPPFELTLQANKLVATHAMVSPKDIKFNYGQFGWGNTDSLRRIRVEMDGTKGIKGVCEVAILEDGGDPVVLKQSITEPVNVDGAEFRFKTETELEINRYSTKREQIDHNTIGKTIGTHIVHSTLAESKSKLALHGIEIPMSIFSHFQGNIYSYAKVSWPLSMLLNINITGDLDINLNSARTEILFDDKWARFESTLVTLICEGIKSQAGSEYWSKWKASVLAHDKRIYSPTFLEIIGKL